MTDHAVAIIGAAHSLLRSPGTPLWRHALTARLQIQPQLRARNTPLRHLPQATTITADVYRKYRSRFRPEPSFLGVQIT